MRIRIIKTPPGAAVPEEIRAQWVGMEVESPGRDDTGGYQVSAGVAFAALYHHAPEAHAFLTEGATWDLMASTLVFDTDCCEEVP